MLIFVLHILQHDAERKRRLIMAKITVLDAGFGGMTAVYELRAYLGKERSVPRSAMALDSRLRRPPGGSTWSGARPMTWCWKSAAIWRARIIACIDAAATESAPSRVCRSRAAARNRFTMTGTRVLVATKVVRLCRARLLACSRFESGGRMPGFAYQSRVLPP